MMLHLSKAPLRLGLAGGGTDVAPYSSLYGGAVVNATIQLFAHAQIAPSPKSGIILHDKDSQQILQFDIQKKLPVAHALPLHAAVCNAIQARYSLPAAGFTLSSSVDVPIGSGLGTSSTLVVAMLGAFLQWLGQIMPPLELAQLAYDIERNQLGFAGGHQDQYAAAFGGINYMQFGPNETVSINPLHLPAASLQEMEENIVLYYTGHARQSGKIIEAQQANVRNHAKESIAAMHQLKMQATAMKEILLAAQIDKIGALFDTGFNYKKQMAEGISTMHIEKLYTAAKAAGAAGGKISGAGGGGFIFFYCPNNSSKQVIETLNSFDGKVYPLRFCMSGVQSWTI